MMSLYFLFSRKLFMFLKSTKNISEYFKNFTLRPNLDIYIGSAPKTKIENISINGERYSTSISFITLFRKKIGTS